MVAIELAERSLVPDAVIRAGVRRLLAERLAQESNNPLAQNAAFAEWMRTQPIAIDTSAANEQHYEVPAEFYQLCLGPRLKYSSGYWPRGVNRLAESEEAMLRLTCERAELADGQRILELGCGWGSLTLWMAENHPAAQIVAMSNSHSQREFILKRVAERGFTNVEVRTANIAEFDPGGCFDRVVSVEMFEHVRNYELLLRRIANWLTPAGKLFIHIFCHQRLAYPFEVEGAKDWITEHFFRGGVMPSFGLLREFSEDLRVEKEWWLYGDHYARTCNSWLNELDANRSKSPLTRRQTQRWRMFFMACAELFAYDDGAEWGVGHFLLRH
jgi:cyclopropane-fatty-acyl-phospholipid synthase